VKLGFEVDAEVPVHRLEVWERIRARGELGRSVPTRRSQASQAATASMICAKASSSSPPWKKAPYVRPNSVRLVTTIPSNFHALRRKIDHEIPKAKRSLPYERVV
jgi:sRNA-binding carbon storage regulator CsrA